MDVGYFYKKYKWKEKSEHFSPSNCEKNSCSKHIGLLYISSTFHVDLYNKYHYKERALYPQATLLDHSDVLSGGPLKNNTKFRKDIEKRMVQGNFGIKLSSTVYIKREFQSKLSNT